MKHKLYFCLDGYNSNQCLVMDFFVGLYITITGLEDFGIQKAFDFFLLTHCAYSKNILYA